MARTIEAIYNEIITEKESNAQLTALVPNPDTAQTFLTDLTTASKVGIWRLCFWVVAVAIWTHEKIFDAHVAEIEVRANELITGTLRWYREQSKLFQFGDFLQWNDSTLKFEYLAGSTGPKIIKQSSAIEVSDQLRIKIAKDDGAGGLVPLSSSEETAFTTYMNRIKFAGTNLSVTNINPDQLKIYLNIYYDPLLIDGSGFLLSDGVTRPIDLAIVSYIENLPFDGALNLTKFIDAIQLAKGVVDPVLVSANVAAGTSPYLPTGPNYVSAAGYLEIDPAFPLNDPAVINYIPVTI
jgi:hypothetical protein